MQDSVPFGGREYWIYLLVLAGARGMDFLSTWVATPNLLLEANPLARKLGWRWGIPLNVVLCIGFALWPLPAIIIGTTSALVAAHNFQSAWLMRTMGEVPYRDWLFRRLAEAPRGLFVFCLVAQTALFGMVGAALVFVAGNALVPLGVGMGLLGYAVAVLLFTLMAQGRGARKS